jgi:hypothetical protein
MQLKKLFASCLVLLTLFATAPVFAQIDYNCRFGNCQPIETIAVSASPNTPTGTHLVSGSLQDLGTFRIRANNGAVRGARVNVTINGGRDAEGTIESVALYNNAGNRISNEVARLNSLAWDDTPEIQYFTMDITIPNNSYADIYVKGITDGITGPNPARIYVQLARVNGFSITGTGLRSDRQITSNSTLALPTVSFRQQNDGSNNPPTTSNPQSNAAVDLRYDFNGIFYAGGADRTLNSMTVTADNPFIRITELVIIVDNHVVGSKYASPSGGSRSMTLSSSDLNNSNFSFDRGTRSNLWVVVHANGVSTFHGTILVPGYSLPFSILLR